MKITLKTVILVALFLFYLVIILSNFTTVEGMENASTKVETNPDNEVETEGFDEETKDINKKDEQSHHQYAMLRHC